MRNELSLFSFMILLTVMLMIANPVQATTQSPTNVVRASYRDAITIILSTSKTLVYQDDPNFTFSGKYFVNFTRLNCEGIVGLEQQYASPDIPLARWIGLDGDCQGGALTEDGRGQSFDAGSSPGVYYVTYRIWNILGVVMPYAPTWQEAKAKATAELNELNAKLKSGQTADWKLLVTATISWRVIALPQSPSQPTPEAKSDPPPTSASDIWFFLGALTSIPITVVIMVWSRNESSKHMPT